MGYSDGATVIAGLISIVIIITFFIMATRLKRIMEAVELLAAVEFRKPENRKSIICDQCQKEFSISIAKKEETISCPHCKRITRIVEARK